MGPEGVNEALAIVEEMLAVVKSLGVAEMFTLFVVATSPLLLLPDVVDANSFQDPALYSATLISDIPFSVIRGVRSLRGSHPILTFAFAPAVVDTLQYSLVLDTCKGGVNEVAVGFGVKYSTVQGIVLPADDVRVKLCPLVVPFPTG